MCSNGTRVFVQEKILDVFLEKLVERTKKMKIGDPFAEDTTVGATISKQQADIVMKYIESANQEVLSDKSYIKQIFHCIWQALVLQVVVCRTQG